MEWAIGFTMSIALGLIAILGFSIPKIVEYNSLKNDNNYHYFYSSCTYSNFYGPTKDLPVFTFSQFLKFYNLNSSSWVINSQEKSEIAPLPAKRGKDLPRYNTSNTRVYHPIFFTNFFEYFKYKKWAKRKLKEATKKENMEKQTAATKKFVALVQEDIDAIRSENERILQETKDTLCKSLTNLRQESKQRWMKDGELHESTTCCGVANNGQVARVLSAAKYNENMQITGTLIVNETGDRYTYNGRNWVKYNDF